jgi:hypothetical protein
MTGTEHQIQPWTKAGVSGINSWTSANLRHFAKPFIGRDHHRNPGRRQHVKSDRELQRVECPQSPRHPRGASVAVLRSDSVWSDGWLDNQPIPCDIRAEASQCEGSPIFIEGAGSDLDCKHRFHFDERQTRHDALRSRLVDDAFDVFRARFLVTAARSRSTTPSACSRLLPDRDGSVFLAGNRMASDRINAADTGRPATARQAPSAAGTECRIPECWRFRQRSVPRWPGQGFNGVCKIAPSSVKVSLVAGSAGIASATWPACVGTLRRYIKLIRHHARPPG